MLKNKKIAVFLGDWFWSSVPYDGIPLYNLLSMHFQTDLIMFDADARLNKTHFGPNEKYNFDASVFRNIANLRIVKDWSELFASSAEYDLIITSSHIAPKTRYPTSFNMTKKVSGLTKCPIAIWDIGGADILTNGSIFADYFFVKGLIWKEWLVKMGFKENKVFVTGSPHYDNFLEDFEPYMIEKILSKEEFDKKYDLKNNEKILLMPTNPGSHKEQFEESMNSLSEIVDSCAEKNIDLLVKTYPHDYIFYQKEMPYSGIYKRKYTSVPQYEYIRNKYPTVKVVESQDHFAAIKHVNKIFNMAGSHVAWETYFTDSVSYSTNYKKQKYYKNLSYLPDYVKFPDEHMNIHVESSKKIIEDNSELKKDLCADYFLNKISIFEILDSVKKILG